MKAGDIREGTSELDGLGVYLLLELKPNTRPEDFYGMWRILILDEIRHGRDISGDIEEVSQSWLETWTKLIA